MSGVYRHSYLHVYVSVIETVVLGASKLNQDIPVNQNNYFIYNLAFCGAHRRINVEQAGWATLVSQPVSKHSLFIQSDKILIMLPKIGTALELG